MTLIVASLFLPYTVEFELDDSEPIEKLAESHPIIVPKKQRAPSVNASTTQLPLTNNGIQIPSNKASLNSTNSVNSPAGELIGKSDHNSSVEEFFFSQSTSPNVSRNQLNLFKSANVSQTNSKSTLDLGLSPSQSSNLLDSTDELKASIYETFKSKASNPSSSSVFIPKSRVNSPPPNTSVVDTVNKKREISLPSLKRVNNQKATKHSHLKFQSNETELDEDLVEPFKFDDKELESDYGSESHYNLPKFGGFSKRKLLNKDDKFNIFEKAPFNVVEFAKGNGGLKNAINSSLEDGIVQNFKWLGTVGIPTDELSDKTKDKITNELRSNFNCESVLPDDFTFSGHYKNFCKQILWPTFHYQIPDNPKSKAFEDHSWEYYKSLNQKFADKILEIYKDGDVIWVHDYHLLLVPQMIRDVLPNAEIGFFLHVSFPSSEVFRCLAQRESLLKGVLGANSVSFQTVEYVRHFLQTCNKLLLADVSNNELRYKGQTIKVSSSPVGIDALKLSKQLDSEIVKNWRELIRERWPNKKMIVGRDKFDRIRGVKQKLLAYELFLKQNPTYIETAVLIQICLKSNTVEPELESEIISIVDRINSLSSNISNSQPVVFLHQDIDFTQYLALIAEADTFIVSSMREGMNLTCHEFIVATQSKKSALILSEFTGSAAVFTKGAFLINPWDIKQVTNSIKTALNLSEEEKLKNWKSLYDVVSELDCDHWVESSLRFIHESWEHQQEKKNYSTLNIENFTDSYAKSENQNRFIVLILSQVPTERMLSILNDLTHQNNDVYILSTYKRLDLDRLYGRVPRLGLIAEAGGFIKIKNGGPWISLLEEDIIGLLDSVVQVAKSYAERLPGSYVEDNKSLVKFHTEQVDDEERKQSTIGDLIAHVNNSDAGIHATLVKNTVYIQKSSVALNAIKFLISYITQSAKLDDNQIVSQPVSPVSTISEISDLAPKKIQFLTVGGDVNDLFEDVLEFANTLSDIENVFTISFGGTLSNAKEHVEGLNELFTVLSLIAQKK
ncbi:hypothetical protein WICMUC_004655 [Wickerhamomyces mucosus]|uniref:Alpha,alpha-trehalose-phosphate synthase (UDP-forming) n=1 Tax=Wickerhamomyces mucosus TaxID=1378264 RepID=A0A9P8T9H0_9ASCO|nr:hypothetical protein WICMUC_004655 [Wickerhamomyces mucosus]